MKVFSAFILLSETQSLSASQAVDVMFRIRRKINQWSCFRENIFGERLSKDDEDEVQEKAY